MVNVPYAHKHNKNENIFSPWLRQNMLKYQAHGPQCTFTALLLIRWALSM